MKFTNYEGKIIKMRKIDNSYVSTILHEALNWNPNLDEIITLCDVLRILDKANIGISRNEVRKAFNKYYHQELHGNKQSSLTWIYKEFGIKENVRVFTSQARLKHPLSHTEEGELGNPITFEAECGTNPHLEENRGLEPFYCKKLGGKY